MMKHLYRIFLYIFSLMLTTACGLDPDDPYTLDESTGLNTESSEIVAVINPWVDIAGLRLLPAWLISDDVNTFESGVYSFNPANMTIELLDPGQQTSDFPAALPEALPLDDYISDTLMATPAVLDGRMLFPGAAGQLIVSDLKSKKRLEIFSPGGSSNAIAWTPEYAKAIFQSSSLGAVFCFSLDDGSLLWSREYLEAVRLVGILESPDTPLLLVVSESGRFSILNPSDGLELLKSSEFRGIKDAAVTLDSRLLVLKNDSLEVYSLALSGDRLRLDSEYPLPYSNCEQLFQTGTELVIAGRNGYPIFAVDLENHSIPWLWNPGLAIENIHRGVSIPGNALLFPVGDELVKISGETGEASRSVEANDNIILQNTTISELRLWIQGTESEELLWIDAAVDAGLVYAIEFNTSGVENLFPQQSTFPNAAEINDPSLPFYLSEELLNTKSLSASYSELDHLQFSYASLPIELSLDVTSRATGEYEVTSSIPLIIQILDASGSEILTSLDELGLESNLKYSLPSGSYTLRISSGGKMTSSDINKRFNLIQHDE